MINNPNHYHIAEQIDILEMFATWKEEAANEKLFSFYGNLMKTYFG